MAEDLFNEEVVLPTRPTFLTVICILTFIGSSYLIISSAVTYFNADTITNMVVTTKKEMKDDIDKNMAKNKNPEEAAFGTKIMTSMSTMMTPVNLRRSAMANIVASIFCLLGAILMWRLKRAGFYIYVFGTLIGIIMPFYIFGNNFITALQVGFSAFIGLLFVIFYAMNLKSMK